MRLDLHSHTTASDGRLTPEQLMNLAAEQGVDVLAITDHDTVAACRQLVQLRRTEGWPEQWPELLAGIEFSSRWGRQPLHIVGLDVDIEDRELQVAIDSQTQLRQQRAAKIAERLEKKGFHGALEGAKRYADGELARPHFARFLLEQGHVKSQNEAFKKYLGNGKVADVSIEWPDIEQVIGWIHRAGGLAVLAHPLQYRMTRTKLRAVLKDFCAAGGDAMEVSCGGQAVAHAGEMARLCNDFGLLASCGSDFHSPDLAWCHLGVYPALPSSCQPIWQARDWSTSRLAERCLA